jgi:HPt (histidine-containing phosphotransfer) domain-containing protein
MKEEQLYDLSSLKLISRGNDAFVQKMVNIFCQETPEMFNRMEEAFHSGNMDKVKETAHKMKPSIDGLNITTLKQLIRDLENTETNSFDPQAVVHNLGELKISIKLVIDKLRIEYPG